MKTFQKFLEQEHINEISNKTLERYLRNAHYKIQHYRYGGGKDKPEAASILKKREAGNKKAVNIIVKRREAYLASLPKRAPEPYADRYPLGGRDERSGRSYSE
jgi:hypothetical protein